MLPERCRPVIVTDVGFKVQWFKAVRALGWHFIGRVHGQVSLRLPGQTEFISVAKVSQKARLMLLAATRIRQKERPVKSVTAVGCAGKLVALHAWAGRRTALNDPNKGNWSFSYNGLGELVKTIAPDDIVTEEFRDNLGRLRLRTVKKGSDVESSQYVYQGLRLTEAGVSGSSLQVFGYDSLGRLNSTTTTIDTLTFTSSKTYDEFGRVFQHFDASGHSRGLRYGYNSYGYLEYMREAATGTDGQKYYEVLAMDERGNVTSAKAGNGLTTLRNFDQKTGFIKDIQTGLAGQVQSLAYEFDGLGNLRARIDYNNLDITDSTQSLHEEFEYDDLNRLIQVKRNLAGNLLTTQALSYSHNGNILTKSDIQAGAEYNYNTRPAMCSSQSLAGGHSVQQIGQLSYCYDVRGNQTHQYNNTQLQRQVEYSHFDLPVKITSPTGTTRFTDNVERQRIKRVDTDSTGTTTTYYLDNVEYQLLPGGSQQYKRYLGDAAIAIVYSSGNTELNYLHRDHLGSVDVISNAAGQKSQCLSFDAFGKRRHCSGWNPVTDAYSELSLGALLAITPRGFTGHEHVDHAEVIHMNGRIYDPLNGRFMQADPIVQAPEHSQSPNRYSYVFNNPLSYTDPTGYEAVVDFHSAMADWLPARGDQLYSAGRLSRPLSSNELKKLQKLGGVLNNQTPVDLTSVELDAAKSDQQQTKPTGQAKEYLGSSLTKIFIANHIIHKTEKPGADEYNPIIVNSRIPEELRKALINFGQTKLGQKIYAQFITDGKSATFVEVTKETAPSYAGVFQAFAEDNEIVYTTDVVGYVASLKFRVPGDGLDSANLGSLVAHEFGHTQVGLKAIGLMPIPVYNRKDQAREESRASSLFENSYREHFGMPLRKSYLIENDVLRYGGGGRE